MILNAQMNDHLKRSGRFFVAIVAVPFVIGLVSAWAAGLGFLLFVLGLPLLPAALLIGAFIYTVRGIKMARQPAPTRQRMVAALAAPAMLVATILLAWPALSAGNYSGAWARLMLNRHQYEHIIENVREGVRSRGTESLLKEDGGVEYLVDPGPPIRVAFNPAGLLDNWSGIIFDPTDVVMQADGFDLRAGKYVAPDEVTKLFGGDLVSCRKLWGHFYDCSFT